MYGFNHNYIFDVPSRLGFFVLTFIYTQLYYINYYYLIQIIYT